MTEVLGGLAVMLVMSLNILIPVLIVVGLIKLGEWRREYHQLVKRVADLEARLSPRA